MFYVFEKIIKNRIFVFFADILFMVVSAFLFFSFLIGFSSGEIRVIYVAFCLSSFLLYLALFHKIAKFSTIRLINVKKKLLKAKKAQKNNEKL